MGKIFLLFLLLCVSAESFTQSYMPCIEGKTSALNLFNEFIPVDSTIDITYYGLYLDIKTNPSYIYGAATIMLKADSLPIQSYFLNLSNNLLVDSVKSGNQTLVYNHSNDRLYITQNAGNISAVSVTIYYKGLPEPTGFGSFIFSSHIGKPFVWSLSQPYGSMDWFPCKNDPDDKADSSSVAIRCRSDLTAVSNGILYNIVDNNDSTKTHFWRSKYKISSYLISIAAGDYYLYENSSYGMPVKHYVLPDRFQSLKHDLDKTPSMISFFESWFGEYPFRDEKYGHAQILTGGAMEHQTCSSMGAFTESVIAHELAHQWYGDLITNKNWHHIWLHEGFATYSEGLWLEHLYGSTAYNDFIARNMAYAKNAIGTLYVRDITKVSEIFNGNRSYSKGAIVLHMFRRILHPDTFKSILYSFTQDTNFRFGNAVTEDFIRTANSLLGMDYSWFFNQWVYGENYPKYTVSWSSEPLGNNNYKFILNIKQAENTSPQYFSMPVRVLIKTNDGEIYKSVFVSKAEEDFIFEITGKPKGIILDPENSILKEKFGDEIEIISGFELQQNYPNPFNPETTIEYTIDKTSYIRLEIYSVNGKLIKTLVNKKQNPGNYLVTFSGTGLSSGIYYYILKSDNSKVAKKMVLLK